MSHRTNYTPEEQSPWPLRLVDLLIVICTASFLCWLLGVFGPLLDAHAGEYHEPQSLVDAQRVAVQSFKKDMAAAKLCRQAHPGSLVRWTESGELVCVPAPAPSKQVAIK